MKECIGRTTSFVLFNGSPTDEFTLDKGSRQGYHLSTFFTFVAS